MVFLAYFFGYQKHNEQEQIVSTYCPSSQKRKKKENSAEYPRKETLRADEQLPKIRRQSSDSTPALNTVHFTLDPAYATNNCKLTLMY